jgi:beta-lactam-binding protein with PASTA domain
MATLNPIGRLGGGLADVPREAVRLALLGILCAVLAGCATAPPRVATLLVGGSVVADGGGEVEVVRADAAAAAEAGFELQAGDVIRTGPRGQAVLSLEGGRVEVIVFENTEVHLSSIFVKFGTVVTRVLKKVKDKFEVESDYAVAGAESTEFLITVGPEGEYRCAVIEGRVQVRSPSGEWPSVSLARGGVAIGRPGSRVDVGELEPGEYNALVQQVNAIERALRPSSARLVVPDVTGLPEAKARQTLVDYGLDVGGVSGRITRGAPIGTVLDQSPAPGSRLQAGRAVSLVVEAEPTTVPELSGMPVAEAARRLAAAGLRTGGVRRVITGARPPGEVLRQRPVPQREVPVGSEVDLWVEAPPWSCWPSSGSIRSGSRRCFGRPACKRGPTAGRRP